MPDTVAVIGSLFGCNYITSVRKALDGPASILIDFQSEQWRNPQGFAKVYNRLIDAAFQRWDAKYVWILGDDVSFDTVGVLRQTQAQLEADPTIGVIFPVECWIGTQRPEASVELRTVEPFTGAPMSAAEAMATGPELLEQLYAGFACACIRREAREAVGRMDEDLGRAYCEDTDWGFRCWKAGYRVVNYRRAYFIHDRGATCNRLVAEGVFRPEEPYEAAERLKAKWKELPLWPTGVDPQQNARDILGILKGWYNAAWGGQP